MIIPTVTATVVATVEPTANPLLGQAYGPNLLTNGIFDAALTGWTASTGTPTWTGVESPASSGNYVALLPLADTSDGDGARTLTQTITGLTDSTVYRIDCGGNNGAGDDMEVQAEGGTVISISNGSAYLLSGEFTAVGTSADIVITTTESALYFANMDFITVREKL